MASAPITLDRFEQSIGEAPHDERWELLHGRVIRMMVGARWEHNRIINNIGYELRRRFDARGSSCRVFLETFRLRVQGAESSLLPDILVQCDPLRAGATSLEHPVAVFEILSGSTSARDRTENLDVYKSIPSLQHIVLVERDRPWIEALDRHDAGFDPPRAIHGLAAELSLEALEVVLPFRSIYRDVLEG